VLLQLKGNTDPRERFHVPSSVGRALIALGAVEEYREPPKELQPVKWSILNADVTQYPPVIRVVCPNCKRDANVESEKGTAHQTFINKPFTHCLGVEQIPTEIVKTYVRLWRKWQEEFQPQVLAREQRQREAEARRPILTWR
jgi:hypothetical protein